jgi:fumarate hydratase class II
MSAKEEGFRAESDSMGEVRLPAWAYWGAQTQRAVENFGVSALRIPAGLIEALALIKRYSAEVNGELGLLEKPIAQAIVQAADELAAGKWNGHFPIDVFQTGSGTSWNMNANELLANRANQLLGSPLGSRSPVHPNDHVNRGQSSNDVIPAAMHIADRKAAGSLVSELRRLADAFQLKAEEHREVLKLGRTHLQDAVPMTLGQELSGYASQLQHALARLEDTFPHLEELALGGTAIGTGLNARAELAPRVIQRIARHTGLPFRQADNLFEALACRDAQAALMAALDTLAGALLKVTADLRLLASGPRGGLGEIRLPSLQPGSSIMPGKVNPVIPEMVAQAAVYVKGRALSVTLAATQGPLELNMMMPLIAYETQDCLELLTRACRVFRERCVEGLEADAERCAHWLEWSLALVTPLATRIGYDRAAQVAYQAFREGKTVRQVALEQKVLEPAEIEAVLDPRSMLGPDRG